MLQKVCTHRMHMSVKPSLITCSARIKHLFCMPAGYTGFESVNLHASKNHVPSRDMRCPFVAVGRNALFIMLPYYWDNMSKAGVRSENTVM